MRRALVAVLVAVLVCVAVLGALDVSGRLPGGLVADPTPTPSPTRPLDPAPSPAGAVLAPDAGTDDATTDAAALPALPEAALRRVLASGDLGPDPGAVVLDVATGTPLLDLDAAAPRTPASIGKLATAAAALTRLDGSSRLRTVVRRGGAPGQLVLVGAGDASLVTRRGDDDPYARRASLTDLARRTAEALDATTGAVTVAVDDSLFTGPAVPAAWPSTYVSSGVASPVSALSVDAGRVRPDSDARSPDPALAAGRRFMSLLRRQGVEVDGPVRRAVAAGGAEAGEAAEVAAVESPTVAELVELMLQTSDNDLAEALLRLVAVGSDRPGTADDGLAVVGEVLGSLGLDLPGTDLLDGSGLARGSAVAPATLAGLLRTAAGRATGELWHLVTGMPVAGFTGTLSSRYLEGRPSAGAGEVRAKTGTLTGVSTLAGTAGLGDRAVVFVVMGNQVADTTAARAALDRFATLVATG